MAKKDLAQQELQEVQANILNIVHSFVDYPHPAEDSITVFMSGCGHHCPGCHNKEAQEIKAGTSITVVDFLEELDNLTKKYKTNNIVFQGGDPLFYPNIPFMKEFLSIQKVYNICIYTGYDIKFVKNNFRKGDAKFWKCGMFDINNARESKKTDTEFILASPNQNWYNTNFKKISKDGVLTF